MSTTHTHSQLKHKQSAAERLTTEHHIDIILLYFVYYKCNAVCQKREIFLLKELFIFIFGGVILTWNYTSQSLHLFEAQSS